MSKMMFENGSVIEIIPHLENVNVESSKGRRLTDTESKYMQELEILKAEERITEIINKWSLDRI